MKIDNKMIAIAVIAIFLIYVYYNDISPNKQTTIFFVIAAAFIAFLLLRTDEKKKITMREAIKISDQWIKEQKEAGIMEIGTIQKMPQCCLYREKGEPVSYWIGYEIISGAKKKYVVVVDCFGGDIIRFKEVSDWNIEEQKDIELIVLPEAVAGIKLISEYQGKTTQIADGTSVKK